MKRTRVAVVGGYRGCFREWEYLGGKKIRLYRTDMPLQSNKNRYKDFSTKNVRFIKVWVYNNLEWLIIRWFKKNVSEPLKEWKERRVIKRQLKEFGKSLRSINPKGVKE